MNMKASGGFGGGKRQERRTPAAAERRAEGSRVEGNAEDPRVREDRASDTNPSEAVRASAAAEKAQKQEAAAMAEQLKTEEGVRQAIDDARDRVEALEDRKAELLAEVKDEQSKKGFFGRLFSAVSASPEAQKRNEELEAINVELAEQKQFINENEHRLPITDIEDELDDGGETEFELVEEASPASEAPVHELGDLEEDDIETEEFDDVKEAKKNVA